MVALHRPTPLDWALFFFCVATWGSAYAGVHVAITHGAPPWVIVAGRLWLATLVLNALLFFRRRAGKEPPPTAGVQGKLALMGVIGAAAPFALFSYAQLGAVSGLVGLYSGVTPIVVAALAPLFARDERLNLVRMMGVVLGFGGILVLMAPAAAEGFQSASLLGQIAAALGAACYAVNTLIARAGREIPAFESAATWTFYGAMAATPFALMELPYVQMDVTALWAIAGLALFPTALASVAYFYLIRSTGAVFVTQTNYLMPLWALALGAIAFGEVIGPNAMIAFVLIVAGLFVAQEGWRVWRTRSA